MKFLEEIIEKILPFLAFLLMLIITISASLLFLYLLNIPVGIIYSICSFYISLSFVSRLFISIFLGILLTLNLFLINKKI